MVERTGKARGFSLKAVLIGALVVALLIVIAQNTDEARLDILMFHVTWPLWVLLTAVALIAFVAGWFSGRTRR
jgi:uncharacterized integral membrane protein